MHKNHLTFHHTLSPAQSTSLPQYHADTRYTQRAVPSLDSHTNHIQTHHSRSFPLSVRPLPLYGAGSPAPPAGNTADFLPLRHRSLPHSRPTDKSGSSGFLPFPAGYDSPLSGRWYSGWFYPAQVAWPLAGSADLSFLPSALMSPAGSVLPSSLSGIPIRCTGSGRSLPFRSPPSPDGSAPRRCTGAGYPRFLWPESGCPFCHTGSWFLQER